MRPSTYILFWVGAMVITWAIGIGIFWQFYRLVTAVIEWLNRH